MVLEEHPIVVRWKLQRIACSSETEHRRTSGPLAFDSELNSASDKRLCKKRNLIQNIICITCINLLYKVILILWIIDIFFNKVSYLMQNLILSRMQVVPTFYDVPFRSYRQFIPSPSGKGCSKNRRGIVRLRAQFLTYRTIL